MGTGFAQRESLVLGERVCTCSARLGMSSWAAVLMAKSWLAKSTRHRSVLIVSSPKVYIWLGDLLIGNTSTTPARSNGV
eukprot:3020589-Pyramimonas_sp.AAC.1